MKLHEVLKQTQRLLQDNSPSILTAIGVSGTVTTAYLTGRASFKAARMIDDHEADVIGDGSGLPLFKERAKLVWKLYIPPAASGALTIGCIIGALRIGNRRTAAITAAYSLSEKAFAEYQEKVTEKLGDRKEQTLRDELAQERADARPASREVILTGPGNVLCLELYTGRYFMSDMETLKQSMNELNAKILRNDGANLSDWYSLIGLPYTSMSDEMGWNTDNLMDMRITTVLSDDQRPCLAFDYKHLKSVR